MVGLPKNSVMLYPYSEEWSMLFEKEKINIYNCIKEYVIDIQHVGSTSIKGMYAKPIIDIVVAIKNLEDGFKLIDDIESIGYHFKGSLGKSNRFFFWKGNDKSNTHNLHIVQHGDKNFDNLILFRNFMSNHCDYREEYCRLKLDLANKYKEDRDAYTKSKTKFIVNVIELAKREIQKI
ncbi:MAG: GrpB family protein [Clostridium sp.]|uniref:GrpB family protein n=1 Tax=Clostridium sp. TaxID=1506 RepID=UPI003217A633